MRGSIYYQTSVLTKNIFKSGVNKVEKINIKSENYQYISSFQTMKSYRMIWNDFGKFLYEVYEIKDFEQIRSEHVEKFMYEKIFNNVAHQYLQKVSSSIGKLEFILTRLSKLYNKNIVYDFSIRIKIVKNAKIYALTNNNYRDRAYENPKLISSFIKNEKYKLASLIQTCSGTRAEGICLIKQSQLHGYKQDTVTNKEIGLVETKEKGGKIGHIYIELELYKQLEKIIQTDSFFKIDYQKYVGAIRKACLIVGVQSEGTHGFRWNFAQKRVIEYQNANYCYRDSLQLVSKEMKHERPDITCHYIG